MSSTDSEKIRAIAKLSDRKYLSLSAFAKLARMSYGTAKRLSDAGRLKTIPVGGVTRVPTEEALRFLTEGNAPQRPSETYNEVINPNEGDFNG